MIHLHKLIRELGRLLGSNAPLDQIHAKSIEIQDACKKLAREHGRGSDVAVQLGEINSVASRVQTLTEGKGILGGRIVFDHNKAKPLVAGMENLIKRIGNILKIEFEETES